MLNGLRGRKHSDIRKFTELIRRKERTTKKEEPQTMKKLIALMMSLMLVMGMVSFATAEAAPRLQDRHHDRYHFPG